MKNTMLKTPSVAIIDYDMGNLFSIQHACNYVGLNPIVTYDKTHILLADAVILPGVGAFGDAMKHLQKLDLITILKEFSAAGKPLLGICLGMQLLFSESEEFGNHNGLGLIEGSIQKFPKKVLDLKIRIPQIQWNQIFSTENISWTESYLDEIKEGEYMYFVHSFYAKHTNPDHILCMTNYEGFEYCSGIKKDNITAFQFHPEKSGKEGLKIYQSLLHELTQSVDK